MFAKFYQCVLWEIQDVIVPLKLMSFVILIKLENTFFKTYTKRELSNWLFLCYWSDLGRKLDIPKSINNNVDEQNIIVLQGSLPCSSCGVRFSKQTITKSIPVVWNWVVLKIIIVLSRIQLHWLLVNRVITYTYIYIK